MSKKSYENKNKIKTCWTPSEKHELNEWNIWILPYVPKILNFWSSKEKNNREGKKEKYLKKENIWSAEEKKTEKEKEPSQELRMLSSVTINC